MTWEKFITFLFKLDFWSLHYKNNYICFLKIELSLVHFKDSGKIAIIHSGLLKARSVPMNIYI